MKEIKIDKKVAMPPTKSSRVKQFYPFNEMKVGDSFLIEDFESAQRVRSTLAARLQRVDDNKKFTVRKLKEDEWRCWRVK